MLVLPPQPSSFSSGSSLASQAKGIQERPKEADPERIGSPEYAAVGLAFYFLAADLLREVFLEAGPIVGYRGQACPVSRAIS